MPRVGVIPSRPEVVEIRLLIGLLPFKGVAVADG